MSERKAEPCSPEIGNTEEISSDVKALLRWTSFEEVENIIGPYVSQAIHKAVNGGYKSAQEVYDDYKIFTHALIQLVKGQDKPEIGHYADEYFLHAALLEKKKMLQWFSNMLSDESLGKVDRDWINDQLVEDKNSEHFCLDDIQFNTYWDGKLKMVDEDVKSDLRRQKEEKLCGIIYHEENEFQADDLSERKKEFKELKGHISFTFSKLESLAKRSSAYHRTLWQVKHAMSISVLLTAFQSLLHVDEKMVCEYANILCSSNTTVPKVRKIHDLTFQNISGLSMNITPWDESINELSHHIHHPEVEQPRDVVVTKSVKKNQGKRLQVLLSRNSDVKALLRWTSFEEVENTIGPYVSQAIHKAVNGGYKSSQEVYDDYKIFTHALIQLVKGQDKPEIGHYADEYFLHAALLEKKKMLQWFSNMLSDESLGKVDRDWINDQLVEDKNSEHFRLDEIQLNTCWDEKLKMVDEDVKNDLRRQKEEKLCGIIYHEENEFQADDLSERKKEFKELKGHISFTYSKLESLAKRGSAYYRTLWQVKDAMSTSVLTMAFQTLLHVDEVN
ncbi:hypothetical protein C5167_021941 [Papaver somniferum]|uniref:Uncharacterized protein n=1 Tax=Papaver somniferum TaxID=3469 RepID=A0A4Y7JGE0_PAPSO|nr:hypothetical protein C5167_021941 [Papaver somniferum]